MQFTSEFLQKIILTLLVTAVLSFAATPLVKKLAEKIGAIDVPRDARRVHTHPIPRLGGLAIFIAFVVGVLLFCNISTKIRGILLGATLIVIIGMIDDTKPLPALIKLGGQLAAAIIVVLHGVVIEVLSKPELFGGGKIYFGWTAIPITIIWIVAVTNAVNLIDGLDGLAVGVSSIASITMLIVALVGAKDNNISLMLVALVGACIGFMPYNFNPAKIFMGDTGALLLGFTMSSLSIVGFFKFSAVISFIVPIMALAIPIADTISAFVRRILKGQNPMKADRSHLHHKLLDMGLSQKQAVGIIYGISAIFGVLSIVFSTSGTDRLLALAIICFILAAIFAVILGVWIYHMGKTERTIRENRKYMEEMKKDDDLTKQ